MNSIWTSKHTIGYQGKFPEKSYYFIDNAIMLKFYMCVCTVTLRRFGSTTIKIEGGDMIAVFRATCTGRGIWLSI